MVWLFVEFGVAETQEITEENVFETFGDVPLTESVELQELDF